MVSSPVQSDTETAFTAHLPGVTQLNVAIKRFEQRLMELSTVYISHEIQVLKLKTRH